MKANFMPNEGKPLKTTSVTSKP
jgi:uridine kinase